MIKSTVGKRLDLLIHRLFPFLFNRRLDPNTLTWFGAGVSLLAAVAFMRGEFPLAGFLMLAGGFFDLVDGVVARHQGISTRYGAFLDSTLDRLVDVGLFMGIAVHYATVGEPQHVLLVGAATVSTVLVSYAKARAELEIASFEVGLLERGERIGLLAVGAVFGWMVPVLFLVTIGSTITVAQRFALAKRELDKKDAEERAAQAPASAEGSAPVTATGAEESA